MKRKITLLLLAAASVFSMNSQVVFQENFTSPFTPASAGWDVQNLSASANPTLAWFQGNGAGVFPAFNGGVNDYFGCNFNNTTSSSPATISSWLITPSVTLSNGMVIEFATRTTTNPASFPDRLEVYYSTAGNGTNVGASPTSVGTFSTLLVSVNPNLTTTGYPAVWTVMSGTITGLASPVAGRVGFRYFVTNGGSSTAALNSDYIGIDAVKFSLPCTQPTLSITQSTTGICSGNSVTLTATTTGTVAASSYTWSSGPQTSSIVVTPSVTTIYTVSATSSSACVGSQTAQILVTATPTISVASYTVCSSPATTATLTASGAVSYSWSTSAVTNSITVTPASTTVYTVTGFGAGGNCPSVATASVTLGSQLSVMITASSNTLCSGRVVTLTAMSAGTTYSWNAGTTPIAQSITVAPTTTTTYSVGALSGTFPSVCLGGNTITINVIPSPTLSVALNPTTICSDGDFTVTASGAVTYTYVLSSTSASTTNPILLSAPVVNVLTNTSFVIGGTGANGCVSAGQVTLDVNPNPTVTAVSSAATVCINNTVTLTGSGGDSYQWSGASTSAANPITYSASTAGTKNFTITGTSLAGCTGTAAVSVNVVACNTNTNTNPVGIATNSIFEETTIFPNPFTTEIKVNVLDGSVVVFNALGQAVITTAVSSSATINAAELPKGVYLVKAYNSNGELVKTSKLVKN